MPQIQYPAYTSPPAFTLPAADAMGWKAYEPDNVSLAPRGRYRTGQMMTALQTVGAVVFAVEQFALPKPLKAEAYYPAPPRPALAKTAQGGGKGVSAYTALWSPFLAYDYDAENWPLPKPYLADAVLPDSPYQFARKPVRYSWPSVFEHPAPIEAAISTDWMIGFPATTNAKRPRAQVLTDVDVFAPEGFPPTLEWSATYPDTTRREKLTVDEYPSSFRPEALHELPATLLWNAFYPERTTRAALKTAQLPSVFRPEAIQHFTPTLLWSAIYPDTTRRSSLNTALLPSTGFENTIFAEPSTRLLCEVFYPDSTRRLALVTAELPSFSAGQQIDLTGLRLQWTVVYPDTTRRADSSRVTMPASFRGEAIEQFQGLRWSVLYPDRTTRLFLDVADMPSAILGLDVHGLGLDVVDRRHDDQTDRAGSRSGTSRMSGF